jgi:hypothetical protein
MGLKQKLQEAAIEVAGLKRMLAEAERNFDLLYKQATSGSKGKKISPADSTNSDDENKSVQKTLSQLAANFTDRVLALLTSEPDKEWGYDDILKELPGIQKTTLPTLLFRLKKAGKVAKVGRGLWKVES